MPRAAITLIFCRYADTLRRRRSLRAASDTWSPHDIERVIILMIGALATLAFELIDAAAFHDIACYYIGCHEIRRHFLSASPHMLSLRHIR